MKRFANSSLAFAGVLLALLVLAGNAFFSLRNARQLGDAENWLQHTLDVITDAHGALADASDSVARQRAYLMTGDEDYRARATTARAELAGRLTHLRELTRDNAEQQKRLTVLDASVADLDAALDAGMARRQRDGAAVGSEGTALILQTREPMSRVRAAINDVEYAETQLRGERTAVVDRLRRNTITTIGLATLVAVGTVLGTYFLVVRDERRQTRFAREQARLANYNRLLIESTGEGIYGVDLQGRCTFLNAAGERLLGVKSVDVVGKPMHAMSHHTRPDGSPYPASECPIYRAFTDGVGCRVDSEKFFRPDGSGFAVEYSAYPIRDGGSVTGAVVTFSDITQRKEQEQSLVETSARVSALADNISQLAWMAEPQGEIFWFNQRWYDFTGQTVDAALGEGWRSVHHPDHVEKVVAKYARCVAAGEVWEDTFPLKGKDGEYRWFLSRAVPIRDAGGNVTRWFGTNTDVTAQRETEAALLEGRERLQLARNEAEAAKEQAEQANVAKSQFLANMSHELRTPLNAVIMYSELLQEEAEDRKLDGFIPDLDKIRNAGRHLLALVNGVLDLSKIEAGKMDLYLETFDAARMLEDVATTVQPLVMKRNNKLILDTAPEVREIHADLTKVRQVLFNLLSNASKFTENGTVRVETRHEPGQLAGAPGWVVFKVVDSGIGMTAEQLSRIFQPFTQADASTTRKYGGTGLGLAISKRFVEMMGGSISAESVADVGTTFVVRLPSLVVKQTAEEAAAAAVPIGSVQHASIGGQQTVLVIDDEASVRDVVSRALAADGLRVVTAADGEAGLKLARQVRPDLIILDVMMPKMDGWAVLTAVKADPELTNTPVIMLTMVHDADMGYVLGASEYLTKPVDREKLASVIAKYRKEGVENEVLIVEDDDATREVIRRSLLREGWAVSEVTNGRGALERLAVQRPALILLDLIMPEMDGFEFLVELRKHAEWRELPVCVLTSKDLSADEQAWLTGKVERIVQKGAYTRDQLMAEVKKITAQHVTHGAGHAGGIGQSTDTSEGGSAATMARVKQAAAERVETDDAAGHGS